MAENEDKAANHNDLKPKPQQETMLDDDFLLESQQSLPVASVSKKAVAVKTATGRASTSQSAAEVLSYRHGDKRTNNPHVGMVDTHSDGVGSKNIC